MILNEGYRKFVESIQPKRTPYGINYDADNGIIYSDNISHGTLFKSDELWFSCMFQLVPYDIPLRRQLNGIVYDISFGVSPTYYENIYHYSDDKIGKNVEIFNMFSYVIYIFTVLEQHVKDAEYIVFDGRDDKRSKIYKIMIDNKPLRNTIENNIGYTYIGFIDGHYVFEKIT